MQNTEFASSRSTTTNTKAEEEHNITQIWNERVSRLDTHRLNTYLRIFWCTILGAVIITLGNLWHMSQVLIISLTIANIILFFILYVRTGRDFRTFNRTGLMKEIEYRKDAVFFFTQPHMLFYKQDDTITCCIMYKVENVPLSVQGNPYAFLKVLNSQGISCNYQFIHKPKIGYRIGPITLNKDYIANFISRKIQGKNRIPKAKTRYLDASSEQNAEDFDLDVVFTFSATRKIGLFTNIAIERLTEQMKSYRFLVSTLLSQNYSHHKFSVLVEDEIIHLIQGRYFTPVQKITSNSLENFQLIYKRHTHTKILQCDLINQHQLEHRMIFNGNNKKPMEKEKTY